jgi:hypothetical protein
VIYRVVKVVQGKNVTWKPQARPVWFPIWLSFYRSEDSSEGDAWSRCKRHSDSSGDYKDELRFFELVMGSVMVSAAAVFFTIMLWPHINLGVIAWLKSLIF